jgi:hypothetical protein
VLPSDVARRRLPVVDENRRFLGFADPSGLAVAVSSTPSRWIARHTGYPLHPQNAPNLLRRNTIGFPHARHSIVASPADVPSVTPL